MKYSRPGSSNKVADALSRKDEVELELKALISSQGIKWEELAKEIDEDEWIGRLKKEVLSGEATVKGFSVQGGQLFFKGRSLIPKKSRFIPTILSEYHNTPVGGHTGEVKTYLKVASKWFWGGMRKDVREWVRNCTICQRCKHSQLHPSGLLQPLPVPEQIWEEISMDFIEGLPRSEGIDTILVVVDRLSKYAHFVGLKHPFTAKGVADKFLKEIFRLHGFPLSIVSDRDRIFMSHFWDELFRLHGSELRRSTAYHPPTNGQTEIVNKALETYLRCFSHDNPRRWAKWLPWAEFAYNTAPHMSTGTTPFRVVYGRDPPPLIKGRAEETRVSELEEWLNERDAMLEELKVELTRAQHRMKTNRREEEFEVGDLVYLKSRPYRQKSLAHRAFEKLSARFYGPYKVIRKLGKVAYELDLPEECQLHPTFHVSQLKRAIGNANTSVPIPPQLTSELEMMVEPEAALQIRYKKGKQPQPMEVLIKWKSLPDFEATCEDYHKLNEQFPWFHLEDKVKSLEGGDVMNRVTSFLVTYSRRKKGEGTTSTAEKEAQAAGAQNVVGAENQQYNHTSTTQQQ